MKSVINVQKKLLPDLLEVMQKRYQILKFIGSMEPVGRRSLAVQLRLTERVLRSEVDFLKKQDLLYSTSSGMSLTDEGKNLLLELHFIMREISGIDQLEAQIENLLQIKKVVIVSGDSDEQPWVKNEIGKACVTCITDNLHGENIIAVTGGSTMASVAEMMTPLSGKQEVLFVPARGGIGEDVKNQANTICSRMAEQTGAKHRVLYVPDQVSSDLYQSLIKDPEINEVLSLIQSASMVLHGIGDAITMAGRRKSGSEIISKLQQSQAVGEAFGYYFNEHGEVVYKAQTIGLQLNDLANAKDIIAVAGGSSKAQAIHAYLKQAPKSTVLITDEGAAKKLLRG